MGATRALVTIKYADGRLVYINDAALAQRAVDSAAGPPTEPCASQAGAGDEVSQRLATVEAALRVQSELAVNGQPLPCLSAAIRALRLLNGAANSAKHQWGGAGRACQSAASTDVDDSADPGCGGFGSEACGDKVQQLDASAQTNTVNLAWYPVLVPASHLASGVDPHHATAAFSSDRAPAEAGFQNCATAGGLGADASASEGTAMGGADVSCHCSAGQVEVTHPVVKAGAGDAAVHGEACGNVTAPARCSTNPSDLPSHYVEVTYPGKDSCAPAVAKCVALACSSDEACSDVSSVASTNNSQIVGPSDSTPPALAFGDFLATLSDEQRKWFEGKWQEHRGGRL